MSCGCGCGGSCAAESACKCPPTCGCRAPAAPPKETEKPKEPSVPAGFRTRLDFRSERDAGTFERRIRKMSKASSMVAGTAVFTNVETEHLVMVATGQGPKPLFASRADGQVVLAAAFALAAAEDATVIHERGPEENVIYEGAPCEVTKLATIERDPEVFGVSMDRMRKLGEIRSPKDVYRVIGPYMERQDQEVFVVMPLDVHYFVRCMPIEVARGAVDHVKVDVKTILRAGVLMNACYLIVVHNHPTGRPTPSEADRRLTKAIETGAAQCGLRYFDHVIIGRKAYYSIREGKLHRA